MSEQPHLDMPSAGGDKTPMFPARRWRFRHLAARRSDVILTIGLAILTVGSLVGQAIRNGQPAVLLLTIGVVPSLLLRRQRPYAALVLAVAVNAVTPDNRTLVLLVMAALYTIASRTPWRIGAGVGAVAAAVAIIAAAARGSGSLTGHGGLIGYAIASTASCAAAVAVGLYVAARRRVLDGLHERAERLDRERELLADRAMAQERVRIAQELHDIVAHNVSLMVVKAQALGATRDDAQLTDCTDEIADLGRQAMTEMHTTLRLLRARDASAPELTPQPGLAQLERLIEQSRGAGLDIELTVEGEPRLLAQGVDLSAFRIIQEAITNVIKHTAGASTKVMLAYEPHGVQLTIVDREHEVRRGLPAEPLDGHGLIGMRERAALFGGTLRTESLPDGFRVVATLPYGAPAS